MPTFYEVQHYNKSTRNYKSIGFFTSQKKAYEIAKLFLEQKIGTMPEIRKEHNTIIFKWRNFGDIYTMEKVIDIIK